MSPRRQLVAVLAVAGGVTGAAVAIGQDNPLSVGRISPKTGLQVSGRALKPEGKTVRVGNHPGGGALTRDGRYLWTLSAGRGRNDIRIVRVTPKKLRCKRRERSSKCRARRERTVARVIQKIEMPGVSGGIAMSPDGRRAFVSGIAESSHDDQKVGKDVPGKQGDVIHVFEIDRRTGKARRDGVIPVPPPASAPIVQTFPPTSTARRSYPRDIAVSPDGRTLLVALNLANRAAIIEVASKKVGYVEVGSYPYGAAITRDGRHGLISNEADGTVSVIDMGSGDVVKEITVGPHLSHPEGIAADPVRDKAYVAVTHSDLVAVLDMKALAVERTLSVGRQEGLGTAPVAVSVTRDGSRLLVADSGEDAVAVFRLPGRAAARSALARRADAIVQHEAKVGLDQAKSNVEEAAEIYGEAAEEAAEERLQAHPAQAAGGDWQLIGRIPVASYPVHAEAVTRKGRLAWVAAKGLGSGPNPRGPNPLSKDNSDDRINTFQYLPSFIRGMAGVIKKFPSDARMRKLTPRQARTLRPTNAQEPPPDTPLKQGGPIRHVFYIVRENRTYDQIMGDDPRGDGDPKLTLFGEKITPNAHALAKRFPLLDHVYANSEASIDGHFWTSAGSVSDYVTKNWHQNYGGRGRPYDFGVYSVTWPAAGFLFDQAQAQGISWFNFGEAIAGTVPLNDRDRTPAETAKVAAKTLKSDLGPPEGCFTNDASSGGTDVVLGATGVRVEVYDSTIPPGAPPNSISRFECFRARFQFQVATSSVPAFTYATFANDHTAGTRPGERTPNAMVAENDLALGQVVELISRSPVWENSLILVIEDDSQDGADHVDAHRIPAFAIGPCTARGKVVHTRYDFLSFIRTLEIVTGMKPLNIFDNLATPLYDAMDASCSNKEPWTAIVPAVNLTERNSATAPNASLSQQLPLHLTDRSPQRYLDRILWQYVHGPYSQAPPPGPNASGLDEDAYRRSLREGQEAPFDESADEDEEGR